jgi:ElaB/YqjD/DUF883 family membrane-anchored ribosome-binding protein
MAGRAKSSTLTDNAIIADEIASIENLISDLQRRLRKLNNTVREEAAGASGDVNDFVSEALAGIMERLRASTENLTEDVAERAAKVKDDTFRRVAEEVEHRPLTLLAIAAGIGFLLGMARR